MYVMTRAVMTDSQCQIATMECLNEAAFVCSKVRIWRVATRFATTGYHMDVMTATFHAMVETQDPMVAIARMMVCKVHYAEVDYQCEIAAADGVKRDTITPNVMHVIAQAVITDCQCQIATTLDCSDVTTQYSMTRHASADCQR